MNPFYRVIRRPLITEKAVKAKEDLGRYSFEVFSEVTKPAIREAIEAYFKVKVEKVRTLTMHGKLRRVGRYTGRRPSWKKAIVTLKKGQKIEMFEAK